VSDRTLVGSGAGTFEDAMVGRQRPLELILARNLLASLSTPAFLVDGKGEIAFFNDAAAALLGRRYEDTGPISAREWTQTFDAFDRLGLAAALKGNRPAHGRLWVRSADGERQMIEASAIPIIGGGGHRGAMVVFWPAEQDDGGGGEAA
jgi:PAS domain-containing protein